MPSTPENTVYLFAAFTITWLLIFGYLLYLSGRIGGLRDEVDALRRELAMREQARAKRDAAPGEQPPSA